MEYNYIKDLSIDKQKLLKKYSLSLNDDLIWEFSHEKYYNAKYFTHKFVTKQSTLSILFHIYKLCYAKIKYFEDNIEKYEPFKYSYKEGFIRCELYDMEFMMHKFSKIMIDIRNLNEIKNIKDFQVFCKYLESFENKKA